MADTLFFWASKLAWAVLSPGSLLAILIIASWLLGWTPWKSAARHLLATTGVLTLAIICLPLGNWLMYPLEERFPPATASAGEPDGIILLGGSFSLRMSASRAQVHLNDSAERVVAMLELARRYPRARLVFTGGSGSPTLQEAREADLARELFDSLGLDADRVLFERESRNTYENARNTAALIKPAPDENWLLVTSAYHMPRAMGAFCQQGWKPLAYPVDYQTARLDVVSVNLSLSAKLRLLEAGWHEWLGLAAYRLTGKTNRLFAAPEDLC